MIVPMKTVSLITTGDKKRETLQKLRKLGIMHIEVTEEAAGERIDALKEQVSLLESAVFTIGENKNTARKEAGVAECLSLAAELASLVEEKKDCLSEQLALEAEYARVKSWGDIDPDSVSRLASKGIALSFYEMPKAEYAALPDSVTTVRLGADRSSVRFLVCDPDPENGKDISPFLNHYKFTLPRVSTAEMRRRLSALSARAQQIDERIASCAGYVESLRKAVGAIAKEIEFETYVMGMADEKLSSGNSRPVTVAYFKGYIEAENLDRLKQAAKKNAWGLLADDPRIEDRVPTKLKNNKFVSLVYPLTDFLGTVPGYFEHDISGWFLLFILIFFGVIFGDGGYGLLICAIAAGSIIKSRITGEQIQPAILLVGLFGLSTVLWGTLTCTWFGLPPEQLPRWLKALSVPVISNVYADTLWSLPWTPEGVGLTTSQNLQIFCFTVALIQLTVAHILEAVRNRRSAKILGDIGSILQLVGIYYLVLSLVVSPEVFGFGLVVEGIPVGKGAIWLIVAGFLLSFLFSNYEGNLIKAVLASVTDIISVLLGVVNVFSDIVSYIRLWAVGLAGAAISLTVNELVSPLLGNFMLMLLAIVLLVFGHGLNMILNLLSVVIHGVRLNTLEFSSHLGMSWSGYKFKPLEE